MLEQETALKRRHIQEREAEAERQSQKEKAVKDEEDKAQLD